MFVAVLSFFLMAANVLSIVDSMLLDSALCRKQYVVHAVDLSQHALLACGAQTPLAAVATVSVSKDKGFHQCMRLLELALRRGRLVGPASCPVETALTGGAKFASDESDNPTTGHLSNSPISG